MEVKFVVTARAVETWLNRIEELEAELSAATSQMGQKVPLPREVADAIETVWEFAQGLHAQHKIYKPTKHIALTNWSWMKMHDLGAQMTVIQDYAIEHPLEYMTALVNGYTIDHSLEELFDVTIREGVKEIFGRWMKADPVSTVPGEDEAELAREITQFVKKAYAEKQSG